MCKISILCSCVEKLREPWKYSAGRGAAKFRVTLVLAALLFATIPLFAFADSGNSQAQMLSSATTATPGTGYASTAANSDCPHLAIHLALEQEIAALEQGIAPLTTAVAELTKILRTPANEPTPNLTFTFLVERHSFLTAAGAPGPITNLPPIGVMDGNTGSLELTINTANGSPVTVGATTTLTRQLNLLEGISFTTAGTYIWHVSEQANSSGVNAADTRSSVEYSPAVYELRVVVTGSGASAIATANFAAIVADGAGTAGTPMYAWGANAGGQLGLGDTTTRNRPTRVGTADNWTQVATSPDGSAAINAEGHLYVWGGPRNSIQMGREGMGGTGRILTPERLGTADNWVFIDVAGTSPDTRMIAINDLGHMYAWGANTAGQLGLGDTNTRNVPTRVPGNQVWASVSTVSSFTGTGNAGRRDFTLAITEEGHLYSWGANNSGQLGRGTANATRLTTPGRVNAASDGNTLWKVPRAGGGSSSYAIGANGILYSWGNNDEDRLGRAGGNTTTPTPTVATSPAANPPVTGWVDVIQQVNSPVTTVALTNDGRIFTWNPGTGTSVSATEGLGRPGGNAASATRTNRPVQMGTASNWVAIGGGNAHSLAMNSLGRLYAWGANGSGQLGLGATGNTGAMPALNAAPRFVLQSTGLAGFGQTGSGIHSMALIRTDPMVFTNAYTVAPPPNSVTASANLTKVLQMPENVIGLNRSFTFHIERYSYNGNNANYSQIPLIGTAVPNNSRAGSIQMPVNAGNSTVATAGGFTTFTRSINVLNNVEFDRAGTFVWRVTEVAQSSNTTWPSVVDYSQALYELRVVVAQTGGAAGPLSITATIVQLTADAGVPNAGTPSMSTGFPIYTWGIEPRGQLGRPITPPDTNFDPGRIAGADWVFVSASSQGSFAINTNGELFAWGNLWSHNMMAQGANPSPGPSGDAIETPVQIGEADNWVMVSARDSNAVAINENGELFRWGNAVGVAPNQFSAQNVPTQIGIASNWIYASAGTDAIVALSDQGQLYTMGHPYRIGRIATPLAPANQLERVEGRSDWAHVSMGQHFVLAITEGGQLFSWGENQLGATGQGLTTGVTSTPTLIVGASNWVDAIAASSRNAAAINENGELFTWGGAAQGRLGNGTIAGDITAPTQIAPDITWNSLHGGSAHFLAFATSGRLYGWGQNTAGQVGIGTWSASVNAPSFVLQATQMSTASRGGGFHSAMLLNTESVPMVFTNIYSRTSLPTGLDIRGSSYLPFVLAAGLGLAFVVKKRCKSIEELAFKQENMSSSI